MSRGQDALQLLARADPVAAAELEGLAAALRERIPVPDVPQVPTPGRRRGVRVVLAVLALGAVLALVAPALGLRLPVLDFLSADPAPPRVVFAFEALGKESPPGMDPGVVPGETRRVTNVRLGGHERTLWVAPTEAGGFCTMWDRLGGGCDRLGTVPLNVFFSTRAEPAFVNGHVSSRYADDVELRFADGSRLRPSVTWVSEPIAAGFFAHALPAELRLEAVVAVDAAGEPVATQFANPRLHQDDVHPDALVERRSVVLRVAAGGGEAVIWRAPTRYEGRCAWLEYQGHTRHSTCVPRGYEHEGSALGFFATATDLVLWGTVGGRAERVDVQFADGDRARVEPRNGFVLYPLPRDRLVEGRLPVRFSVTAADGSAMLDAPVHESWFCLSSADGGCPIPGAPVGGVLGREPVRSADALCARYARELAKLDLSSRSLAALESQLRRASLLAVELTLQLQAAEPPADRGAEYGRFATLHEQRDHSLRFLVTLAQDRRVDAFWSLAERLNADARALDAAAAEAALESCVGMNVKIGR